MSSISTNIFDNLARSASTWHPIRWIALGVIVAGGIGIPIMRLAVHAQPGTAMYDFMAFIRNDPRSEFLYVAVILGIVAVGGYIWYRTYVAAHEAGRKLAIQQQENLLYLRAIDDQVIFYTLDAQGNCTYVNREYTNVTGYAPEEAIGRNISEFLVGGVQRALTPEDWKRLYAGKVWKGLVQYRRKDNKKCWVRCSIVPTIGESGLVEKYSVVAIDLTAHQEATSRKKLSSAFDLMKEEIFVLEPESLDILFVNKAGMKRRKRSNHDNATQPNARDYLSPRQLEKLKERCKAAREAPDGRIEFEAEQGDGRVFEITLQYLQPDDDEPMFVAIYHDITARKSADRAKSEFVSTVSHELRTPLTSIKGSLSLALSGSLGEIPEGARRMLDIAHTNSDRLTRLINDILDIEKIEAGKMDFAMEPVDLVELVEAACQANAAYAEKHGVTYVPQAEVARGREAMVAGDAHRLMQVMDNLMSNAAKFSDPGSTVEVRLWREGAEACLAVVDHGAGIPEEAQAKIFDKFTQVDSSDTRSKGGTGLGLPIALKIIEHHGGTLTLDSAPGKGSTFTVRLPLLKDAALSDDGPEAAPGSRGRILVCEDEPDVAAVLKVMLEKQGFSVTVAETAARAEELIAQGGFDGMTLDLGLPDKTGIEIVETILQDESTSELPVIVVSANSELIREARAKPFADRLEWLNKPIYEPLLKQWLNKIAAQRESGKPKILHVEHDASNRALVRGVVGDVADIIPAGSLREARELIDAQSFDLIILETALPDGDGAELIAHATRDGRAAPPVVVFSVDDDAPPQGVVRALVKSRVTNADLQAAVSAAIAAQ